MLGKAISQNLTLSLVCTSLPSAHKGHFMNKYYLARIKKINKFCPTCGKPITNPKSTTCAKHFSLETRLRMSKAKTGAKFSKDTRHKLRQHKLGNKNPMWGHNGEKHPNWKGGHKNNLNFYYQTDWEKLRNKIYRRDNFTCQKCGVHCVGKPGRNRIQCHHVVPYKISRDNSESNLTTLCNACHIVVEKEFYKTGAQLKLF